MKTLEEEVRVLRKYRTALEAEARGHKATIRGMDVRIRILEQALRDLRERMDEWQRVASNAVQDGKVKERLEANAYLAFLEESEPKISFTAQETVELARSQIRGRPTHQCDECGHICIRTEG